MTPSSDRRALLVLILGACIIGLSPILVRLTHTGPAAAGMWRVGLALPLLALLAAAERRPGRPSAPAGLLTLAGVLFAGDLACWHYSVRFTSVANATVLSNLTPVLVTAFAWLFLKERPGRVFLGGLGLAIGGAVAMALAKPGAGAVAALGAERHLGDALGALTAVWYGTYFLLVREARKRVSTGAVMLWCSVVSTPILLVAAWLLHEPIWPTVASGWAACIGLGVMHATGQGAIAWALGRLPTSLAAVVVLVQPVVSAALGWIWLGEPMSWPQALGGLTTLAGVAVAQASTRPGAQPKVSAGQVAPT
jgi:drug/metabolite transporter (DMT)-like permease